VLHRRVLHLFLVVLAVVLAHPFLILVDGDIFAGLITGGFVIGVSGSFGIILSLALKYDGCSLVVGGSTVGIFVLLLSILDSFNILDVMKDDN
jgi:hypothetical protein